MFFVDLEICKLRDAIKKTESKPIFLRYRNLSVKKKLSVEERQELDDMLNSRTIYIYNRNKLYLNILLNPFDEKLESRIEYLKSKGYNSKALSSFDYNDAFEDDVPVKLWLKSVFYHYNSGNIDEKIKNNIVELYKFLYRDMDKGTIESKLAYNFFVLGFILNEPIEEFLESLDMKSYYWRDVKSGYLDLKVRQIVRTIECLKVRLNSSLNDNVNELILSIISLLESKKEKELETNKVLVERKKEKRAKNSENVIEKKNCVINFKTLESYFKELKELTAKDEIVKLELSMFFSNGKKIKTWWDKLLLNIINDSFDLSVKEYIQQNAYDILYLLTNERKYPLYEGSNINYGPALRRLFLTFDNNLDNVFGKIAIPQSIISKLMFNSCYPSEENVKMILNYINNISLENYLPCYKTIVDEATLVCNELLKEIKEKNIKSGSYEIYSIENIKEYEEIIKSEVDENILADVKNNNYDWYVKCITYYYISKTKGGLPSSNMYFYDGSIIHKWYMTQVRTLTKENGCAYLTDKQVIMLNKVEDLRNKAFQEKKNSTDVEYSFKNNFVKYFMTVKEYIETNKKLPTSEKIDSFYLLDIWNYMGALVHQKETWLSDEQIMLIKNLRQYYCIMEKSKNKIQQKFNINFGVNFALFLESIGMSLSKFADFSGFSLAAVNNFSRNSNLPSEKSLELMLLSVNSLDESNYRADQIKDIEEFKRFLCELLKENLKVKRVDCQFIEYYFTDIEINFGQTGDIFEDVPKDILDVVIKSDKNWFDDAVATAKYLANVGENSSRNTISSLSWYNRETNKIRANRYSYEKKVIFKYLLELNNRKVKYKHYPTFLYKMEKLEEFVHQNCRFPVEDELIYDDETKGSIFYGQIREVQFHFTNRLSFLEDAERIRIKKLFQDLAIYERPFITFEDSFDNGQVKIGQRLNFLRISLGYSKKSFPEHLGWSQAGMSDIYNNRISLSDSQINDLYKFLESIDKTSLRIDQISDLEEFISVLNNRSFEKEGMALKKVDYVE